MTTPSRRTRFAAVAVAGVLAVGTLAACGSSGGSGGGGGAATGAATGTKVKSGLKVYYIPRDTQNPYEVLADKGGQKALKELGGTVTISSGTADTAAAQIPSIQAAIQAKADAIVIAGNDPIGAVPPAQPGGPGRHQDRVLRRRRVLRQLARTTCSSTRPTPSRSGRPRSTCWPSRSTAPVTSRSCPRPPARPNQNSWIKYMKVQLKKYPNMKLVSTVYGNDDPATSLTVLQGLLAAHPNLKGIISPTTVGISTAAQYLSTHKNVHVTLTGLGLPSEMSKYVKDGTVTSFELWNPSNLGYLAGYAAAALASGTTSLQDRRHLQGRHARDLQGAGARRRHRPLGRARPADRVQQGQHRPVQLLIGRRVGGGARRRRPGYGRRRMRYCFLLRVREDLLAEYRERHAAGVAGHAAGTVRRGLAQLLDLRPARRPARGVRRGRRPRRRAAGDGRHRRSTPAGRPR